MEHKKTKTILTILLFILLTTSVIGFGPKTPEILLIRQNVTLNGSGSDFNYSAHFNQVLNTTSDVTFNEVNTTNLYVNGNALFGAGIGVTGSVNSDSATIGSIFLDTNEINVVGGVLNSLVALDVQGHIYPSADKTYNIGNTTHKWNNAEFGGTVNVEDLTVQNDATIVNGDLEVTKGSINAPSGTLTAHKLYNAPAINQNAHTINATFEPGFFGSLVGTSAVTISYLATPSQAAASVTNYGLKVVSNFDNATFTNIGRASILADGSTNSPDSTGIESIGFGYQTGGNYRNWYTSNQAKIVGGLIKGTNNAVGDAVGITGFGFVSNTAVGNHYAVGGNFIGAFTSGAVRGYELGFNGMSGRSLLSSTTDNKTWGVYSLGHTGIGTGSLFITNGTRKAPNEIVENVAWSYIDYNESGNLGVEGNAEIKGFAHFKTPIGGFHNDEEDTPTATATLTSAGVFFNMTLLNKTGVNIGEGTYFNVYESNNTIGFTEKGKGVYQVFLGGSFQADRVAVYHCSVFKNNIKQEVGFERNIGTINAVGSASDLNYIEIDSSGDWLNLRCKTNSGANPVLTFNHLSLNVMRVSN